MQTKNNTGLGRNGVAKHPQREEWIGFLYGEVSRREKAALNAHLKECSTCRAEVESWQGAMLALDEGKTQTFHPRPFISQPWLKWGIAAAFVLFVGFAAGRFTSGAALKSELRAELLTELKQQQEAQFTSLLQEVEKGRDVDNKAIFTTLGKMQAAHDTDLVSLREHLETVALMTQNSLQYQDQQIMNLANNNQPTELH